MFWYMEIVSIEKKTFEMMLASFNALSEKVAALRRKSDGGRLERWLTGEEPQVLLQAGGGQAADSAYRHDLSRWKMTLFLLTT